MEIPVNFSINFFKSAPAKTDRSNGMNSLHPPGSYTMGYSVTEVTDHLPSILSKASMVASTPLISAYIL